jgi:hypothetical protein
MQDLPHSCEGMARIRARRGALAGAGPGDVADTGHAVADDAVMSLGRPRHAREVLGLEPVVAMPHPTLAAVARDRLERAISGLDRRQGPAASENAEPRIPRRSASGDARRGHAFDAFAQKLAAAMDRRRDADDRPMGLTVDGRFGAGAGTRSKDSARELALSKPGIGNQAAEKISWDEECRPAQARVRDQASVALLGEAKP